VLTKTDYPRGALLRPVLSITPCCVVLSMTLTPLFLISDVLKMQRGAILKTNRDNYRPAQPRS
jgi:hypothetical protein